MITVNTIVIADNTTDIVNNNCASIVNVVNNSCI